MKQVLLFIATLSLLSCHQKVDIKLPQGSYRAVLEVQDGERLPFIFEVRNDGILEIHNADEIIEVSDIVYKNDSIQINFPVYETYIIGKFNDGKITDAKYIKESLDQEVNVTITPNSANRFLDTEPAKENASGIWEMYFTEDDSSSFIAKGIFNQEAGKVTGTIRTSTGDYRYLEGVMDRNVLKYSVFDGSHAFLFTSTVSGDSMQGVFYSGNHYKSTFIAKRNQDYKLPHEDSLTFLKEGYEALEFSFPDTEGNMVSLSDNRFKGKVVLVQIMGTWCPNCLDESRYYAKQYETLKSKGVEIVALAFESAKTQEKAFKGIERLKDHVGMTYPILLAQYGSYDKQKAQEKLPMLNHVLSYPTTIYIDKKGKVRKIHTGFNGPATGEKYQIFQKEFTAYMEMLVSE